MSMVIRAASTRIRPASTAAFAAAGSASAASAAAACASALQRRLQLLAPAGRAAPQARGLALQRLERRLGPGQLLAPRRLAAWSVVLRAARAAASAAVALASRSRRRLPRVPQPFELAVRHLDLGPECGEAVALRQPLRRRLRRRAGHEREPVPAPEIALAAHQPLPGASDGCSRAPSARATTPIAARPPRQRLGRRHLIPERRGARRQRRRVEGRQRAPPRLARAAGCARSSPSAAPSAASKPGATSTASSIGATSDVVRASSRSIPDASASSAFAAPSATASRLASALPASRAVAAAASAAASASSAAAACSAAISARSPASACAASPHRGRAPPRRARPRPPEPAGDPAERRAASSRRRVPA